jgi:selenocysteine lyase/cysteine desulfurase
MWLTKYLANARAALQTYPGFRLFLASTYLVSALSLMVPEAVAHGLDNYTVSFVYGYWTATVPRIAELLTIVIVFVTVFLADSLRGLHQKHFGRSRQELVPFGWVLAGKAIGLGACVCAIYVIPFLSLHIPTVILSVGKLTWALSAAVPYMSLYAGDGLSTTIQSLSQRNYDRNYFDSAALAPLRSPVVERIMQCLTYCEKGPSDAETQTFIRFGRRGTSWAGLDDMFARISNFFGVTPERITLHERTTNALTFALDEVLRNHKRHGHGRIKLLTTDLEYPGIIGEILPDLERHNQITIMPSIALKELVLSNASKERVNNAIRSACSGECPDVMLISHVYYACGFVIDIEQVYRMFPEDCRPIFIVDGAQSTGNVEISPRLLEQVDYYATGVHKWLLVPRPLGILIRNNETLRGTHGLTDFELPNRPDSSYPIGLRPFSITISYDPYFGLSSILRDEFQVLRMASISSHNQRLAELFRNEMMSLGYRAIGEESLSSIVSISFGAVTEALHRGLQLHGVKCKFLRIEGERDPLVMIRFCFHFFHGRDDLFRLIDRIEGKINRVRA